MMPQRGVHCLTGLLVAAWWMIFSWQACSTANTSSAVDGDAEMQDLDESPDAADNPEDEGRDIVEPDIEEVVEEGETEQSEPPVFNRDDWPAVHGWILLDRDRNHISEVLDLAGDYGVTEVQLSHDLAMNIEEITEDTDNAAYLRDIAQEAKRKGLDVMVWAHEFTKMRLAVCFDPADPFWDDRRAAYAEAFELIPELDGVVLMFGSSSPDPWYSMCICADEAQNEAFCVDPAGDSDLGPLDWPPAPERVALIINAVADVTESLNKRLYIRTFIHSPNEQQWLAEALAMTAGRAYVVMSKPVPQDFQPYYPHDSTIGATPGRPSITEFDLAGEYWGQSRILNPAVEELTYRFRHLWAHQGVGTVSRIERGSRHAIGTPNEINVYAVSHLMRNPDAGPGEIYAGWFDRLAAEQGVALDDQQKTAFIEVHRLSWEATRKRHYVLGFWALAKDSELPAKPESEELKARSTALYDEGFDDLYARLERPDVQTLSDIFQENREAVAAAEAALSLFETVAPALPETLRQDWRKRLRHQWRACRAWMWAEEAIWGRKLYGANKEPAYRRWLERAIENLYVAADETEAELGDVWPGSPSRIRALADNLRTYFPAGEVEPLERTQLFIDDFISTPDISGHGGQLAWTTSATAECRLRWGDTITHTDIIEPAHSDDGLNHTAKLTGLSSDTLYLVRAVCASADQTRTGGDWYLWTPPAHGR